MTSFRGLESPCINTKGVYCPNHSQKSCKKCPALQSFKAELDSEPQYMSAVDSSGLGYAIYFQNDGVVK